MSSAERGLSKTASTTSFLSSFMSSLCRVRNKIMYVLSWQTVYALTRVLFWCLFPSLLRNSGNKHQNNPLVSHSSTYIILYIILIFTNSGGLPTLPRARTLIAASSRMYGKCDQFMMTSLNGNISRVTGPLCGEFTGPRWIPRTKAMDVELWCFLWSASE